ncbi:MAG: antibiotic biosynthesis monooxygenase [Rhodobiaceae bacterium]|nr:antibiotic biosynthesis monooxygenase [Rhodobiaceae bacterium]MCC0048597.1 antibiotic biosynthesis monooxygenase [Rhodobiaceae bacterium]
MHYIAMNRFKVGKENGAAFEAVWLNREVHLTEVPGFVEFHLLRGPEREDHVLYSSHTIWESEAHFLAWTKSQAFRDAHKGAGDRGKLFVGHPEFEGFTILQTVTPVRARGAA